MVDRAVCLMYNLFPITLTFGMFICLQVILYKRSHLPSIPYRRVMYLPTF